MKRRICSLSLALVVCLCFAAVGARAENWSEDYYRVVDTSGTMSDADRNELDQLCIRFLSAHKTDLAVIAISMEKHAGEELADYARSYYEECNFGYGSGRDGFMYVYDRDTGNAVLLALGTAEQLYGAQELEAIRDEIAEFYPTYGMRGMVNAAVRNLEKAFGSDEATSHISPSASTEWTPSAELTDDKPYWYPESTEHFTFFSDPDAPRVVDDADIFSGADEAAMEARIAEIRRELDRDIVIFTDLSSHGLSHAVYAADFYDFNGYGVGEEREGFCLFICMQPDNRGFLSCGTGSDSMSLQTESVANALDDVLYEYMVSGRYADGAKDWIENIRTLYRTGIPFAPDWYPARGEEVKSFHDADAPRVFDELGLLSAAERDELASRAAEISERYGVDLVLHTAYDPMLVEISDFAQTFYRCMGYGFGSGYDGIQATVYRSASSDELRCCVNGYGAGMEKLSDTAAGRLESRCENALGGGAYNALNKYLSQTEHLLKTGRVPRSLGSWMSTVMLGAIVGALFGGIALAGAKRKMRTPQIQVDADAYIVRNSLLVEKLSDDFVRTTTWRRYSPPPRDSGGSSSSSHRSSYSSSYRGSSGASHSSSGRRF